MVRITAAQGIRLKVGIVPPIRISEEKVPATDARRSTPPGFRQATWKEVLLRYKNDADFRLELEEAGWVWISKVGLGHEGQFEILEDGKLSSINSRGFSQLPSESRVVLWAGSAPVAVTVYPYGDNTKRLIAHADNNIILKKFKARVAYVRDMQIIPERSNRTNGTTGPDLYATNELVYIMRE